MRRSSGVNRTSAMADRTISDIRLTKRYDEKGFLALAETNVRRTPELRAEEIVPVKSVSVPVVAAVASGLFSSSS
jgi:hypothetical protein